MSFINHVAPQPVNQQSIRLWRHILKWTKLMPKAQADYYQRYAKEHFWNYAHEDEPDRIKELQEKGYSNTTYIIQKYKLDKMTLPEGRTFPPHAPPPDVSGAAHKQGELPTGIAEAMRGMATGTVFGSSSELGSAVDVSRSLKGLIVEKDVIGQLVLKEIEPRAKNKTRGILRLGDVLCEIDGVSVRGVNPNTISAVKLTHKFKFGRRKEGGGGEYFEVTLSDA